LADSNTSGPIHHLKTAHGLDKNGNIIDKKRKSVVDDYYRLEGYDDVAAVDNTLAAAFDHCQFKAVLYQWVISDNLSFEQLESPYFKHLISYLNPRASACIPTASTISRTVAICYDRALGVVTETLQSAITKINLSFDLWTSKNKLALLGLCAILSITIARALQRC
jgi:hypothetical protein